MEQETVGHPLLGGRFRQVGEQLQRIGEIRLDQLVEILVEARFISLERKPALAHGNYQIFARNNQLRAFSACRRG
jgi:hypothetical protein